MAQPPALHRGGGKAFLIRVSFTGELGWEVHAANADIPAIHDAILGAGAKPFGMWALNSLRIEKGYRAWKGDLSTDYSMLEGGLERFVKFDKPQDFPGKAALLAEKQQGRKKAFVTLTVDAGAADAPYMSTVWHDGQIVGETTSGAWGYRVKASVALAMLRADLAVPGTRSWRSRLRRAVKGHGAARRAALGPGQRKAARVTLPATMSGVTLTRHGGPEALEWREDLPVPRPGPGQVLVRVLAAGVNNTDINTRVGWYAAEVTGATEEGDAGVAAGGWGGALDFPRIQGGDLCGEVVALGPA